MDATFQVSPSSEDASCATFAPGSFEPDKRAIHHPFATQQVHREAFWRDRPAAVASAIQLGRWWSTDRDSSVHIAPIEAAHVTLEIALSSTMGHIIHDGCLIVDGRIPAGTVQMTPPGVGARAAFLSACDLLHLFVPVDTFLAMDCEARGYEKVGSAFDLKPRNDPMIDRLARAIVDSADLDPAIRSVYLEGLSLALLARVIAGRKRPTELGASAKRGLVAWRLRRVLAYIDDNLAEPLRLAELASAAGLSRMHFAAQFRAATGFAPHEFVMRRRVERAKQLLATSREPLVGVALDVGFQTQAHFSTVFRRYANDTPARFRQQRRLCAS